jgi:hypothetical protein
MKITNPRTCVHGSILITLDALAARNDDSGQLRYCPLFDERLAHFHAAITNRLNTKL